jgi:DNA mismatch repair protein MutS
MKQSDTPLMKQWGKLKEAYPDTIILFKVGDYYESFKEDAKVVAKETGVPLTKRENISLAGFQEKMIDTYLPKIVRAGYRVATAEPV